MKKLVRSIILCFVVTLFLVGSLTSQTITEQKAREFIQNFIKIKGVEDVSVRTIDFYKGTSVPLILLNNTNTKKVSQTIFIFLCTLSSTPMNYFVFK